jgi:hypothetical protein
MEELELSKNEGEINRRRGLKLSRREGLELGSIGEMNRNDSLLLGRG